MAAQLYPEYAEEQLNYFRICYIYTDILAEGLRTIFKQEWDNRYKTTLGEWKDEPRNGFDFCSRESPKNREKHARHLDIIKNGNRAEWDCAMLFYAILYSDCTRVWDPRVRAHVDNLRKCRNKYLLGMPRSHLSRLEFEWAVSEVTSAFHSLGLPIYQIQGVLDCTVEFSEEQLNYFRICFVITDLVTEGLRSIFKQEWDERYRATPLGEWKDHSQEVLIGRKTLIPMIYGGDRAEWDCAMLIKAILYSRNIHNLSSAVKLGVDVLRKCRNEHVKHIPRGHLSDSEFHTAIDKVLSAFQRLSLPTSQILYIRNQEDTIRLKKRGPEHSELGNDPNIRSIPLYILARGQEAKAAYQRALETGKTSDKRVKVYLVGQDRVGKTSVGRSLKGEQFRKDESSTNGVQMDLPLKHVGAHPWKNSTEQQQMTSFDYNCALYLSNHLSTVSSEEKALGKKKITEKITGETELPLSVDDGVAKKNELQGLHWDRKTATKNDTTNLQPAKYPNPEKVHLTGKQETRRKDDIPERVASLAIENLSNKTPVSDNRIWPVILDFAGQAIYRAIHPLFTSREAIYVLMLDLTKKLSATAQCFVREPDCNEVEIQSPDSNDTNLDHIMRWMDLVHSYKHVDNSEILPPVILVGTHADLLVGDPSVKMKCVEDVKEKICDSTRDFSEHIGKTFAVNNTLAGKELDEEDPQIVSLREEILKVGDVMPHTKMEVPLRWLQVEDKVYDIVSKGTNYITRQDFKENICDEICQFEIESDFEVLLNFLHDRGTVVYHGCANDPGSLVVLNPKWLVDVLCQIITVEKQNEEKTHIRNLRKDLGKRGILHPGLLDDACERLKLADIKKALLAIMKKFNLLCEYTCKGGYSIYLVPCMLTSKADEELLSTFGNQDPAPAYITFNTQYVPGGLFSRLVVLFVEFAERRIACDQPKLCANFARFFIGDFTGLDFVCYKRVIKVRVWDHDNANLNPVEKEPDVCSEVLSFLMISLTRLHEDCHWLRAVSWDLCARCDLCPPEFVTEKRECVWHEKQGCSHDDCAHYVSLTKKPVRCARTDGPIYRPPKTWIQALEEITGHKQPCLPEQIFQTPQQIQHNASKVNTKTDLSVELKKIASDRGYMISDNQGSGNCMFHSLSEQLYLVKGIEISYKELRQSIVQYLRKNQQKVDGTDLFNFVDGYRSWDDYLTNMEQNGTWGDHVILYAAANCYETCIHVISSLPHHGDLTIRPDRPVDSTKPLVLGHVHELHYVSLQPMQVTPAKERCYTVGSKREALDQGIPSVTPAKVPRLGSECQEPNQDTQSVIAPEKVAPPGTILKEYTVITDDLERLSLSVGNNWVSLGRRLNIDQAMLDSIQIDPRWPGLAEKAFQMLLFWRKANGSDATYQVLCLALCHEFVSCRILAEKICFRKAQP